MNIAFAAAAHAVAGTVTSLVVAIALTSSSVAQSNCPQHPAGASAIPLGRFQSVVPIPIPDVGSISEPSSPGNTTADRYDLIGPDAGEKKKLGSVQVEIFIYRLVDDRISYLVCPESIMPLDSCGALDLVATTEIFDLAMRQAAIDGARLGYSGCSATCGAAETVEVMAPLVVERTGAGCLTRFRTCAVGAFATRVYGVCCPVGLEAPDATLVATQCDPAPVGVGVECEAICW